MLDVLLHTAYMIALGLIKSTRLLQFEVHNTLSKFFNTAHPMVPWSLLASHTPIPHHANSLYTTFLDTMPCSLI